MSKVDAQRAMKAARLARTTAAPAVRPTTRAGAAAPAAAAPAADSGRGPGPDAGSATCGHRNMAGKECVRPSGHSEKSHRYS